MNAFTSDDGRIMDAISRAKTQLASACASLRVAVSVIQAVERLELLDEVVEAKADSKRLYAKLNSISELIEKGARTVKQYDKTDSS